MGTQTQEIIYTQIRKRNGSMVPFDEKRIFRAISAAFCTKEWGLPKDHPLDFNQKEIVDSVFLEVLEKISEGMKKYDLIDVEWIQDTVELILMRQGHYAVAKDYILYRQNRAKARELSLTSDVEITQIKEEDGKVSSFYRS